MSALPAIAHRDPAFLKRWAAKQIQSTTDPYKRAYWKLTLMLGRLPTIRDKGYWELPAMVAGVPDARYR